MPAIAELDECLFCGIALDDETRTREHIFPSWLQEEYGLSNERLGLLNGSFVPYRQLTVPACRDCNTVHAGQLEQRIREDRASPQDMYTWLLKIQLGVMHWETARPASRDQRQPTAALPILPSDAFDITFLHALFDVLKRPDPQFAPNPLGSVFSFETQQQDFFYTDRLYRHPLSEPDSHNYSAACIVVHGRCWIALFDDCGQLSHVSNQADMDAQVADGKDPLQFFPELLWMRACLDWMPHTVVLGERQQPAQGVMFTLPLGRPREFPRRQEDLDRFYESAGFQMG